MARGSSVSQAGAQPERRMFEVLDQRGEVFISAHGTEAETRAGVLAWLDANGQGRFGRLTMLYRPMVIERRLGGVKKEIGRGRMLAWWLLFGDRYDASASTTTTRAATPAEVAALNAHQHGQSKSNVWVAAVFVVVVLVGSVALGLLTGAGWNGLFIGLPVSAFIALMTYGVLHLSRQQAQRARRGATVTVKRAPWITVQDMRGRMKAHHRTLEPDDERGVFEMLFADTTVRVEDGPGARLAQLGPIEDATVTYFAERGLVMTVARSDGWVAYRDDRLHEPPEGFGSQV